MEQLAYVVSRMSRVTPQVDFVWYKQIMGEQQYPQNVDKNQMTCERVPQMDPMFWNLSGFSPSQQRSKTANALDFGFNDFFRPIIDPTFWALCRLLSGHSPAVGSLGNHFWGSQLSIWNSTLDFGVVYLFLFTIGSKVQTTTFGATRERCIVENRGVLWPPSRDVVPSGLVWLAGTSWYHTTII